MAKRIKGGDIIGRIVVIEFDDKDSKVFDKVAAFLSGNTSFEKLQIKRTYTSLPGFTIYPERRKAYCDNIEENYWETKDLSVVAVEYRGTTVKVDSFKANAFGMYNMHGNVSEWFQ